MNIIKLNQYGSVLTGGEFGADVMKALSTRVVHPVCLDFDGVEAIGSSFGDEVILVLARVASRNKNNYRKSRLRQSGILFLHWQFQLSIADSSCFEL
jgi:STAS-like domain of unknown function (DUF4325)